MKEAGIQPNTITYSAAISACEKGNQWKEALALLSKMKQEDIKADTITYNAAISACEKGNQWEEAKNLFNEEINHLYLPVQSDSSVLDFHVNKRYTQNVITTMYPNVSHIPGVPLSLAKVMLSIYLDTPRDRFDLVVGQHGDNILKDGLLTFMNQKFSQYPLVSSLKPGCLSFSKGSETHLKPPKK